MNDGALERPWSGQHAWDSGPAVAAPRAATASPSLSSFPGPSTQTPTCTAAATPRLIPNAPPQTYGGLHRLGGRRAARPGRRAAAPQRTSWLTMHAFSQPRLLWGVLGPGRAAHAAGRTGHRPPECGPCMTSGVNASWVLQSVLGRPHSPIFCPLEGVTHSPEDFWLSNCEEEERKWREKQERSCAAVVAAAAGPADPLSLAAIQGAIVHVTWPPGVKAVVP